MCPTHVLVMHNSTMKLTRLALQRDSAGQLEVPKRVHMAACKRETQASNSTMHASSSSVHDCPDGADWHMVHGHEVAGAWTVA